MPQTVHARPTPIAALLLGLSALMLLTACSAPRDGSRASSEPRFEGTGPH